MTTDEIAARFLVSGRVQGVFFRASAQAQATRLGLRGHARNLTDGRVEVLAAGPAASVDALADWLKRGPPMAAVERVERTAGDPNNLPAGFEVRR